LERRGAEATAAIPKEVDFRRCSRQIRTTLGQRLWLVGQFEFLDWTGENHLHSRFIGLRGDKELRSVGRE